MVVLLSSSWTIDQFIYTTLINKLVYLTGDETKEVTADMVGAATEEYVDNAISNIEIPEAPVKSISVNGGAQQSPDTNGNIDLTISIPEIPTDIATTSYVDEAIATQIGDINTALAALRTNLEAI